jgi:hypothetical protein
MERINCFLKSLRFCRKSSRRVMGRRRGEIIVRKMVPGPAGTVADLRLTSAPRMPPHAQVRCRPGAAAARQILGAVHVIRSPAREEGCPADGDMMHLPSGRIVPVSEPTFRRIVPAALQKSGTPRVHPSFATMAVARDLFRALWKGCVKRRFVFPRAGKGRCPARRRAPHLFGESRRLIGTSG